MSDDSIHISIGESNGNEAIRLYESENGRIRMGASEGTPKYIGARAVVTRVDGGVKITLSDYKGTTEEIVYESIESITYNDDGSITFVMPSGSTFTTGSLIGPRGEKGDPGDPGPPAVTSYNELLDKPEIEGIVLEGNKTFSQLDLNVLSNTGIQEIFDDLI